MSPKNKKKLEKIRKKLDKLDDDFLHLIKIRTNLVTLLTKPVLILIKRRNSLSSLSSFLRTFSNFFLFLGDIYTIGFILN